MKEFYTRERANAGVKLPLAYPDGKKSEHWLTIRSTQSDAFRNHIDEHQRMRLQQQVIKRLENVDADSELTLDDVAVDTVQTRKEEHIALLATLVAGWSFKQECNEENVIKLLTEAPQIADAIDKFSTRKKHFFALPSTSSTSSSEKGQS